MNIRMTLITITACGALAVAGAGCQGKDKHAAASVSAETSQLAHSKKVKAAEKAWKPIVEHCGQEQHHWFGHAIKAITNTFNCATRGLTPAEKSKAESCMANGVIHVGFHHAASRDEAVLALCLAQVTPPKESK
jgi:hypothetical protein